MKKKIVALTGLSGVGKSTLITAIAARLPLQHLQASALIKKGRETSGDAIGHDRLRYSDLDENQLLLVRGLNAAIDQTAQLVVLDSHTLIEREADEFLVEPRVFASVGICGMIFLREEPLEILRRRQSDRSRIRPIKDEAFLAASQANALAQAEFICRTASVPLFVETPSAIENILASLISFRDC
jgi:adenylate kinase